MTSSSTNTSYRFSRDWWLSVITRTWSVAAAAVVVLIILFLIRESWPALSRIGPRRFVSDASWHPLSGRYNLVPMLVGTALTTIGALLLASPIGIGSAIFQQFYAPPRLADWHGRLVELLAGLPSVVYGLWGLVVLVPLLAPLGGSGQSLLAATLILGLMVLPLVALTANAALASVSAELIAGGAALGLSRWGIVWRIALPAAAGGIRTGLLLATTRALGETMAVVMVAGNVVQFPDSLTSPIRTLTANMALEMGYATAEHRSILFVSGLVLMLAVCLCALLMEWRSIRLSP